MGKTIQKLDNDQHREFILAGKSFVTFLNTFTGNRFTYSITKGKKKDIHFVSVLYQSDNETKYAYIGTIFGGKVFRHTEKSRVSNDNIRFKAFEYVFNHVVHCTLPERIEIWHDGKCGRCGRSLTVPESIKTGFGPECLMKINRQKKIELCHK